jgi:nucleotide-binding universal stress UspA family protein
MALRIIVPVDGSEPSQHAIGWAIAFARRAGATISVCSVVDAMLACVAVGGGAAVETGPMIETLRTDAARFSSAAGALASAGHIPTTTTVLEGSPADEIAAFAREHHADIIVMGTHARHGLARGVLGSVTAAVVRSSAVAVVTIRAQSRLDGTGPIVVAVDDSAASTAAGRLAITFARLLGNPVHLVHVGGIDRERERDVLEALSNEAARAGVAASTEIRLGATVETLIAATTERDGSLLATGTHGRDAVGRLFLGSVAEGLIRDSIVPVLVAR